MRTCVYEGFPVELCWYPHLVHCVTVLHQVLWQPSGLKHCPAYPVSDLHTSQPNTDLLCVFNMQVDRRAAVSRWSAPKVNICNVHPCAARPVVLCCAVLGRALLPKLLTKSFMSGGGHGHPGTIIEGMSCCINLGHDAEQVTTPFGTNEFDAPAVESLVTAQPGCLGRRVQSDACTQRGCCCY